MLSWLDGGAKSKLEPGSVTAILWNRQILNENGCCGSSLGNARAAQLSGLAFPTGNKQPGTPCAQALCCLAQEALDCQPSPAFQQQGVPYTTSGLGRR